MGDFASAETGAGTAVWVRARPATRRGGAVSLRAGLGSAYRLALWRRDDDGPEAVRPSFCLRSTLRHRRGAGSKERDKAERRDRRAQPALDRNPVAFVGAALTGTMRRARMAWRQMTMI